MKSDVGLLPWRWRRSPGEGLSSGSSISASNSSLARAQLAEGAFEALQRVALKRIHMTRFKFLFDACRCPRTAAHFWATCISKWCFTQRDGSASIFVGQAFWRKAGPVYYT